MSTTVAKDKAAESPEEIDTRFLTPEGVAVMDIVGWSIAPEVDPSPAIVVAVGTRAIDLIYFDQGSVVGSYRNGVVYEGAPEEAIQRATRNETGVWRFSPMHRRVLVLEQQLSSAQEQIAQLQAAVDHARAKGNVERSSKGGN